MRSKRNTIFSLANNLKLGLNNKQKYKWHLKKTLFSFIICPLFIDLSWAVTIASGDACRYFRRVVFK
jgi:hypothetical protein